MKFKLLSPCFLAPLALAMALPVFPQTSTNTQIIARGLEGPRGMKFGPDGALYVAEAGTGGKLSTVGICEQVPAPIGPYTGGTTARISKIAADGTRTTVAQGFPSATDAQGDILGVADVAFLDGTLYALIAGGGCSHGNPDIPASIVKVNLKTGSWTTVADLSRYVQEHPVKYPSPDDFEPDGSFYSMIELHDRLYVVEPNHGLVLSIDKQGAIRKEIDISAFEGHIVPTSIAALNGNFYVGNLNLFPIDPNWARVLTLTRDAFQYGLAPGVETDADKSRLKIINSKAGFTTVVGLAFGPDGLLYALELSAGPGYPTPGLGKVVRIEADGSIQDVATGLAVPTAMTFGADGKLYVSNLGAAPAGAGQVIAIAVP